MMSAMRQPRAHVRLVHAAVATVLAAGALLLAGCAAFSPDGGMGAVEEIAGAELNKNVAALRTPAATIAARAKLERLLRRPLGADAAVQIALLNNRDLQAAYNELGLAEAARIEASLPPNPRFSFDNVSGSGALDIERRVVADILALATLPARADIATDRFRQAQLTAAEATLRIAAETRRAYVRAVATRALVRFLTQAQSSAEAATQLARKLGETGAMNKLDQARDQVFYAELTAQLATARQRATSERERLVRLLGLWGSDLKFRLPENLPALPERAKALPAVEVAAVKRRVDLEVARIELDWLAKSYGLTKATRFIDLAEVAGISKTMQEPGSERFNEGGIGIELQVPLFDFGEVRVRRAEETYMQAVNRLTAKAVAVRSQAREAYQAYRSTYDIAQHYQREVLPLRKIISDETLLRYNAMQIDVFALLAEARQRIASTVAAIEAQRDFWLADANLTAAIIGGGVPMDESGAAPLAQTRSE
jgi:outer membrane protein TolC